MRGVSRRYLALWVASYVLATLAGRVLHGSGSVYFWMATTSLPTLDGGSVVVPSRHLIPLGEVWHYLILSIAGGITLAKILAIIAQATLGHHWKRATIWMSGLLVVAGSTYLISLLAYQVGPWRKAGLWVFYNTRGSLWPTLAFTAAILAAKLLSNAAPSHPAKKWLFLSLSGLTISSVLVMFMIPIFAPTNKPYRASNTLVALITLDGLMYATLALVAGFAMVKLLKINFRRSRTV